MRQAAGLQAAAWTGSSSNRQDLTHNVACMQAPGEGERRLLSIVDARAAAAHAAGDARRERIPVAVRHPRALAVHKEHPYMLPA